MGTPEFVIDLRAQIGTAPLWLMSATVMVLRDGAAGPEVLLAQRADDATWSTVGGIVDPGEHPAEAARREAREETGLDVEVGRMLWCTVSDVITYRNGDVVQYLDHGFIGRVVGGEAHVADEESLAVGWFPVDDLPAGTRPKVPAAIRVALADPRDVVASLD